MTTDPDKPREGAENGAQSPSEQPRQRFDPFTNEGDMFKIVLGVGGGVLVVALLAFLAGLIF